MPSGGVICYRSLLLWEPETTIDFGLLRGNSWKILKLNFLMKFLAIFGGIPGYQNTIWSDLCFWELVTGNRRSQVHTHGGKKNTQHGTRHGGKPCFKGTKLIVQTFGNFWQASFGQGVKHWILRKVWGLVFSYQYTTSKYDVFSFLIRIKGSKVPRFQVKSKKYLVIPWSHCNQSTFFKGKKYHCDEWKKSGNSCKTISKIGISKPSRKKHVEPPATGYRQDTHRDANHYQNLAGLRFGGELSVLPNGWKIDQQKRRSWIYGLPLHPDGFLLGRFRNSGTPKSSILMGFSIINHPFWGTSIFGNTLMSMTTINTSKHPGD